MGFTNEQLAQLQELFDRQFERHFEHHFDKQARRLRGEWTEALYGVENRLHVEIQELSERMDVRFAEVYEYMDSRFAEVDKRFAEVYEHVGDVANEAFVTVKATTDDHGRRIKRLERRAA